LLEVIDVLKRVEGLAFVHFDESDVVRHHLVQRIIRAYDEHKNKVAEQQTLPLIEPRTTEIGLGGAASSLEANDDKKSGKLAIVREEGSREGLETKEEKVQEG
jgi:hypothetical protein